LKEVPSALRYLPVSIYFLPFALCSLYLGPVGIDVSNCQDFRRLSAGSKGRAMENRTVSVFNNFSSRAKA
jgi:hypothetical protein